MVGSLGGGGAESSHQATQWELSPIRLSHRNVGQMEGAPWKHSTEAMKQRYSHRLQKKVPKDASGKQWRVPNSWEARCAASQTGIEEG